MRGYTVIEEGCIDNPKDTRPPVSVIVPIYNAAATLDQALTSIETQTLPDIEIICINDGSTDNSLEIVCAHAQADERIRVIDRPNAGYGSACNRGLDEARGTWIAIVEPDDYILPDMYQAMTHFASKFKTAPDIVKTPYYSIWNPGAEHERLYNCGYKPYVHPHHQPFTLEDPGFVDILGDHPSIWSALYKRSFLLENDIRFPEYPGAGWADNPFMMETYCKARAIVYLPKPFYVYREDTPEKAAAFARTQTLLPLQRWQTMTDILDAQGIIDAGVRRAHNSRGFLYLSGIVEEVDLTRPDVCDAARAMFHRMDDELVFGDRRIAPAWKRHYAELKGVELPHQSQAAYVSTLAQKSVISLINEGPMRALERIGDYFSRHKARTGQ